MVAAWLSIDEHALRVQTHIDLKCKLNTEHYVRVANTYPWSLTGRL